MSLIEFRSGEVASSSEINNNFSYLENRISELAGQISSARENFAAQVNAYQNSIDNLLSYSESFVSTGTILPYTGSQVPDGYLLCDGSELLKEEYPELYAVIGISFGSSDSTSFCIPDLSDRTVWGVGESLIGYQEAGLPNIKGTVTSPHGYLSSASEAFELSGHVDDWNGTGSTNRYKTFTFDASKCSSIYSDDVTTVLPRAVVVPFIIKY